MTTLAPAQPPIAASMVSFPPGRSVPFIDPVSGVGLANRDNHLVNPATGATVAEVIHGLSRFVARGGDYAAHFGWQWKKWRRSMSDAANNDAHKRNLILGRTKFARYPIQGKTLLECGCGAGNDTEILVSLGLAEVHSFDLSNAVEEAVPLVDQARRQGTRLVLSQASILSIPYPDRSFDIVYCHRVLQHTPDPEVSLRALCAKVKPGGILFVHCYQDTPWLRGHWRNKLRWFCKRMPPKLLAVVIDTYAPLLQRLNRFLWTRPLDTRRNRMLRELGFRFVPFAWTGTQFSHLGANKELEINKCVTFDFLTAWHDHPMTAARMRAILTAEGFAIDHFAAGKEEPLWATARRKA